GDNFAADSSWDLSLQERGAPGNNRLSGSRRTEPTAFLFFSDFLFFLVFAMFVEIGGTVRKLLCESTTASEAQTTNLRNARTLIRVKLRTGISQKPTYGPLGSSWFNFWFARDPFLSCQNHVDTIEGHNIAMSHSPQTNDRATALEGDS